MIRPFHFLYKKLLDHHAQGYDVLLLSTCCVLALLGLLMIYSASIPVSDRMHGSSVVLLLKHLAHLGVGLAALWVGMRVPYERWQPLVPVALVVCFVLLIVVLLPGIGHQVAGARRWLRLGPLSLQPSELLKLALVMYLASYLNRKPERVVQFLRGMMPSLAVMGVFLALVMMQPDFGTMVLIALTMLLMIFVGGAKPGHVLASLVGLCVIGTYLVVSQSYRTKRVLAFLDPWQDRLDSGFQIIQSYLAFGRGGLMGVGLGDSTQKLFFLPDAHTDFIFSILGEELGLVGVLGALALFAVFLWRGFRISASAPEDFGRYLAYGITTLFALQVSLNMGVVMGLMPTKGLPLPFISYGGTSLVMSLFMTGILLNIGRTPPPGTEGPRPAGRPRR